MIILRINFIRKTKFINGKIIGQNLETFSKERVKRQQEVGAYFSETQIEAVLMYVVGWGASNSFPWNNSAASVQGLLVKLKPRRDKHRLLTVIKLLLIQEFFLHI